MLQEAGHIKNTVVFISRQIQCSHLLNSEVACVLASLGIKVQPQIILDPDYLPGCLFVSYDYALKTQNNTLHPISFFYHYLKSVFINKLITNKRNNLKEAVYIRFAKVDE